jgi:F0F1-type ATP synthase membrane subunit c/vacuolar-type H+-ATPase subunit K
MTIDAVNQQDVQRKRVSPLGAGLAVGAVGAGAGYLWGGGKYVPSLEEVFAQDPDTFTRTMKKALNAGADEKEVFKLLKDINNVTFEKNKKEFLAHKHARETLTERIKSITDFDNAEQLNKNLQEAETALNNKRVTAKINGNEVKDYSFKQAHKAAEDAAFKFTQALDTKAIEESQAALNEAHENLKLFKNESESVFNAKNAIYEAQTKKFSELAKVEGSAEQKLAKELAEAESKFTEAQKKVVGELGDETKNAFKNIQKSLKEIKWGKVGLWGGIAAAVGIVSALIINRKK